MCVWSTSWLGEALGVASAKVITRMHLINRITEKVSNVISNINIQSDRTICYGIGELVLWMWMTHSAHRTLSPWILSVCVWIGNRWAIKWQNWDHKYASYASFKWKSCHRTRKKVQNNKMKHRISFAHGAVVGVCICVCVCVSLLTQRGRVLFSHYHITTICFWRTSSTLYYGIHDRSPNQFP